MLRYQMNPHFLFNSLNSIRALISENKKNAKTMVTELSEFLRYSLLSESCTEAPLSHEIEAIRHYYAIEKIRFEDRLEITFDIAPMAEEYPIISFLIHPLVENAVKYGMRTSPMPLKIHVTARADDHRLSVNVCNTGKWIEPGDYSASGNIGTGTGLENVRKRLFSSYPNRHTFGIEPESDCVSVKFEIWKNS
jgi:LytS/YehU family sensor histidine kinase